MMVSELQDSKRRIPDLEPGEKWLRATKLVASISTRAVSSRISASPVGKKYRDGFCQ